MIGQKPHDLEGRDFLDLVYGEYSVPITPPADNLDSFRPVTTCDHLDISSRSISLHSPIGNIDFHNRLQPTHSPHIFVQIPNNLRKDAHQWLTSDISTIFI